MQSGSASIDDNPFELVSNHEYDVKEVEESPEGEYHEPSQSPAPPAPPPTPPDSKPERIGRTEWQEGAEIS